MGLVKITLCFSLRASAMAYLWEEDTSIMAASVEHQLLNRGMRAVNILTQHTLSSQQRCAQTQGQTHCYQYTKWPPAGKGRE